MDDKEAKLIEVPKGVATLQAELRRFQDERGCPVAGIQVGEPGVYLGLSQLVRLLGLNLAVWLDHGSVREGCVRLVA